MEDGDTLMDAGKLKSALPYYQKVIYGMPFPAELHGRAALQWSICQDSVLKHKEARWMYEKLRTHPSKEVSRKAKQFASSFLVKTTELAAAPAQQLLGPKANSFLKKPFYLSSIK